MSIASDSPDPEIPAKATRRKYSNDQKARILDEYEMASSIERASICRREKIYSSTITKWRAQRAAGVTKRGRKPDPQRVEKSQLEKRCASLEQRLKKAEQVIDIQGKVYELLRACAGESADHLVLPPWQK